MRIVYTCPKCGQDLEVNVLTSNPPKNRYRCTNPDCDWSEDEREDVIRIPYTPMKRSWATDNPVPECCRNCSNHPLNGGSGICMCTLPYMTHTGGGCGLTVSTSATEYMFGDKGE